MSKRTEANKTFEEYFKKQFHYVYTIGALLSIFANLIDIFTIKDRHVNLMLSNGPVIIILSAAYILYIFKKFSSKNGILLTVYALLINICLTQALEAYHATFIVYFIRASLFILIIMTVATLTGGKMHAIIIMCCYYGLYVHNMIRTGDIFFVENIYSILVSFFLMAFLLYIFSDHLRKIIHDIQNKSSLIYNQNEQLIETNQQLENSRHKLKNANTELSKKNVKLLKREEQLKQAITSKDKFISIIAHDLKNPSNTLKGFLEMLYLKFDKASPEKLKLYIHHAKESSEHLNKLLLDLLEWSRTQGDQLRFDPTYFNLQKLTLSITEFLSLSAKEKNVTFETDVPENIMVYADYDMIFTVLRNFISNAIKFSNNNAKITFKGRCYDQNIIVNVIDKGVGMSKEVIGKVFNSAANYTSPGTNGEAGTGLGLKICKELIDKHQGDILIESEHGMGTKITLILPQQASEQTFNG